MYPFNFRPRENFIDFYKIFVAMPFKDDYEYIYKDLIKKAIDVVNDERTKKKEIKLKIYRGKDPKHTRSGWLEILENLFTARIVIGVLTDNNPNVFYELGIAHATQIISRQLLISEKGYNPKFDLKDLIYITYDKKDLKKSITTLSDSIKDTMKLNDYANELSLEQAESRLGLLEFRIIMNFGNRSHFAFNTLENEHNDFENEQLLGLSFLCHYGLLRLSTKSNFKSNSILNIVHSFYWTKMGNTLLKKLKIINNEECIKRINDYYKYFRI
ncbi:MAG: hypothetical protein ISS80_05920 [Candidatus Cloacimonetes bacterium]|nr:hypothetical protein [Candidatus Cloacimonadota bacterium]